MWPHGSPSLPTQAHSLWPTSSWIRKGAWVSSCSRQCPSPNPSSTPARLTQWQLGLRLGLVSQWVLTYSFFGKQHVYVFFGHNMSQTLTTCSTNEPVPNPSNSEALTSSGSLFVLINQTVKSFITTTPGLEFLHKVLPNLKQKNDKWRRSWVILRDGNIKSNYHAATHGAALRLQARCCRWAILESLETLHLHSQQQNFGSYVASIMSSKSFLKERLARPVPRKIKPGLFSEASDSKLTCSRSMTLWTSNGSLPPSTE